MSIGPWQVILILAVIVLLFGAGKIPRLMGDVAKGIKAFRSNMKDEDTAEEKPPAALENKSAPPADGQTDSVGTRDGAKT